MAVHVAGGAAATPPARSSRWRTSGRAGGCARHWNSRSRKPAASRVSSSSMKAMPVMWISSTAMRQSRRRRRPAAAARSGRRRRAASSAALLDEAVPGQLAQVVADRAGRLPQLGRQAGDARPLVQLQQPQDLHPQRVRQRLEGGRVELEPPGRPCARVVCKEIICKHYGEIDAKTHSPCRDDDDDAAPAPRRSRRRDIGQVGRRRAAGRPWTPFPSAADPRAGPAPSVPPAVPGPAIRVVVAARTG